MTLERITSCTRSLLPQLALVRAAELGIVAEITGGLLIAAAVIIGAMPGSRHNQQISIAARSWLADRFEPRGLTGAQNIVFP